MENVFVNGGLTTYGESWNVVESRNFTSDEIQAVRSNTVVNSQYGKSVCFFMKRGGQTYIPMSNHGSDAALGSSIDMHNAKLVTLHREGDGNILRVEI